VIHAYLSNKIAFQKQLMGIASLVKGMPDKSTAIIDLTHSINATILYLGNNDANHISEEFLKS
jgi:hypothetical protein